VGDHEILDNGVEAAHGDDDPIEGRRTYTLITIAATTLGRSSSSAPDVGKLFRSSFGVTQCRASARPIGKARGGGHSSGIPASRRPAKKVVSKSVRMVATAKNPAA